MRELLLMVTCDRCETNGKEEDCYTNFEIHLPNKILEMDLCDICLSIVIEGARVKPGGSAGNNTPFECSCGSQFKTDRGRRAHQTRKGHS